MVAGSSMDYLSSTILTILMKNLKEAVVGCMDLLLRNLVVIPVEVTALKVGIRHLNRS